MSRYPTHPQSRKAFETVIFGDLCAHPFSNIQPTPKAERRLRPSCVPHFFAARMEQIHPESRKAFETSLAFQPGDRCCDENPPESRNALLTKFRQQRIPREDRILPVPEATGERRDRGFIRFPGFHGRTKKAGGKTLENESFPARTLFMQSQAKAERNTGFPGRSGRSPVPLRSGGQ